MYRAQLCETQRLRIGALLLGKSQPAVQQLAFSMLAVLMLAKEGLYLRTERVLLHVSLSLDITWQDRARGSMQSSLCEV